VDVLVNHGENVVDVSAMKIPVLTTLTVGGDLVLGDLLLLVTIMDGNRAEYVIGEMIINHGFVNVSIEEVVERQSHEFILIIEVG